MIGTTDVRNGTAQPRPRASVSLHGLNGLLSLFTFMHWKMKWQPTPVFLPGESQGQGSLVGCRLWMSDGICWEGAQRKCPVTPVCVCTFPPTPSAVAEAHTGRATGMAVAGFRKSGPSLSCMSPPCLDCVQSRVGLPASSWIFKGCPWATVEFRTAGAPASLGWETRDLFFLLRGYFLGTRD